MGNDGPERRPLPLKQWHAGDVTITRVVESETPFSIPDLFPDAIVGELRELAWLTPSFMTSDGTGVLNVQALIVDTPTRRIIVDTCVGNDKHRGSWAHYGNLQTDFLADLTANGFPPSSFDIVLCTHMHVDHVGWNTMLVDGEWVPTFPNARYLLSKVDFEYWSSPSESSPVPGMDEVQRLAFSDSLKPVLDAGLVDLIADTHRLCDEVVLVPTPGHSPGHVSVVVESAGERVLITGDVAHHPCQLAHPDWNIPFADHDGEKAVRTREDIFASVADREVLVIGTHWAGPSAGRVKRSGRAYRLEC